MRIRGTERSSILLLGRNTVVIGAIVIIILSFGLGYFLGYKGGDVSHTDKESETATRTDVPSEEKRVLESAPADSMANVPSIKPPEFPPETEPKNLTESGLTDDQKALGSKSDTKTERGQASDVRHPEEKSKTARIEQPVDKIHPEAAGAEAKDIKSDSKTAKKGNSQKDSKSSKKAAKTETAYKKLYAVQFGAFPSRDGAEHMQQTLKAKGIKAYIVNKGKDDPYFRVKVGAYKSKKEAERAANMMRKKTGLQNFVTIK
jgi:cell division septation protein DedD